MVTIPSRAQTAGIPRQHDDVIIAADVYLITGNEPAVMTKDELFAPNQNIPALTPVGRNDDDLLVPISDSIPAIGITIIDVVTGASAESKGAPVYRAGCFNPDVLNWPETLNTEAERMNAFEGAPTPTNIILRRPKTHKV